MSNTDKAGFESPDDRGDAGICAGLVAQDPAQGSVVVQLHPGEGGLGSDF